MGRQEDLKHAAHNEDVFNLLLPKTDFVDWIVTTAFYSALHYVDAKLFPIKYSEKGIQFTVTNMESYAVSALNRYGTDKHVCRLKLVERNMKDISFEFNWLYSTCKTARYHNYTFPNPVDVCKTANDYLSKIKAFCK